MKIKKLLSLGLMVALCLNSNVVFAERHTIPNFTSIKGNSGKYELTASCTTVSLSATAEWSASSGVVDISYQTYIDTGVAVEGIQQAQYYKTSSNSNRCNVSHNTSTLYQIYQTYFVFYADEEVVATYYADPF